MAGWSVACRCTSAGALGLYVSNRLLLYYNGIILKLPPKKFPADATAQEIAVLDSLAEDLGHRPYVHIQLHNRTTVQDLRPFLARAWRPGLSYTYIVPLNDPAAAVGTGRPEPEATHRAL